MKKIIFTMPIILGLIIVLNLTSCLVFVKDSKGNHNGWYKNPHNPHNPFHNTPTIISPNGNNGNGHGHGHHK